MLGSFLEKGKVQIDLCLKMETQQGPETHPLPAEVTAAHSEVENSMNVGEASTLWAPEGGAGQGHGRGAFQDLRGGRRPQRCMLGPPLPPPSGLGATSHDGRC